MSNKLTLAEYLAKGRTQKTENGKHTQPALTPSLLEKLVTSASLTIDGTTGQVNLSAWGASKAGNPTKRITGSIVVNGVKLRITGFVTAPVK